MNSEKIMKGIKSINESKFMMGIAMIVLNLGSKYIMMELSETQEELMANKMFRRFIIFTIAFIGTRDILVSLGVTAIFVLLVSNIFNEDSKFSVVKKKKKPFKQVGKNDYLKALKIMELYELQQKNFAKAN